MLGRGDHGDHRYGLQAVSVALAPTPVTLATGTPGGIYHPVGNAICRMFNLPDEHQAKPCVAVSSGGSVENIRRIESGGSTFGLSQTDVAYAAFHGEGPFAAAGPDPKLRMLIALYPEAFTVVARADTGIRDFQDLRDKRVGIGRAVPDTHSPATSSSHRMGGRYRIQSVYWSSGRQSRTRHFAATRSMRSYSKRGIPMA
jgi:TRAP transporter TAXI family solute receptor